MTKVTLLELKENSRVYRCRRCDSDLALYDHIVCKNFKSRNGEAYLFEDAINISAGPVEERLMMTGIHTVTDIFCRGCKECLGWSYIKASEKDQKYKEGKVVLEATKIVGADSLEYGVSHGISRMQI